MASYYFDTSALVKGYAREVGTGWIRALLLSTEQHTFYTVRLAGPEMVAALFRKTRRREIPRAVAARLAQNFRHDWRLRYRVLEINAEVSARAMDLVETHGLRGYDAVHLAAALLLHESRQALQLPDVVFVAADDDLLQAATAEGLAADNPNDHFTV